MLLIDILPRGVAKMAIQVGRRYPKRFELRDGSVVTVRPMSRADESALVDFFARIPPEERYFLKEDVTSPLVIREWIDNLDYDKALPLLALDGRRVVADAALLRHRSAAFGHSAEVRVVIDPAWRSRGLAVGLMNELAELAAENDIEELVFEFVRGVQDSGIEAAEFLGASVEAVLPGWVRGSDGTRYDVVFLRLPLGSDAGPGDAPGGREPA